MVSLPVRMKAIQSKMKALERPQHFSRYNYIWIFPDVQRQLTKQYMVGRILPNLPGQDFRIVLDTCKNEEDPIKNKSARYSTTLYINFSDAVRFA